jgi:hypothetical protein
MLGGGLVIERSIIELNDAGNTGGGLRANGPGSLVISDSVIRNNEASGLTGGGSGGGVLSFVPTGIARTTITDNLAPIGGGMALGAGGYLELIDSTLSQNAANHGAGLFVSVADAHLHNTTVSGNAACISGGGIRHNSGLLRLRNTTITDNRLDQTLQAAHLNGDPTEGCSFPPELLAPGLGSSSGEAALIRLQNSILAGNRHVSLQGVETPLDCQATFTSEGFNLIGVSKGCDFQPVASDLVDTSPGLGPLADNGGPTHTHALMSGSPAIDSGGGCSSTDQRGVARPADGDGVPPAACDIGAFELTP